VELRYPSEQPGDAGGIPCARRVLSDVFAVYREQFRRWFGITAPTSLAGAVVLLMADQQIRAIFRSIPRGQIPFHLAELAETGVLRFGGFFIAWLLGAFALGAIATAVSNLDTDDNEAWRHDSHQRAREHLGGLFSVALITFCGFVAGMLAVGMVAFAIGRVVGPESLSRYTFTIALAGYVIVASVLSWFGMAIPLILRGKVSVWAALKKSVQLSNGYEGLLFLLIIESLVGSYIGWYAVHYSFALLVPISFRYTAWYGWMVYFASVLASAAVQPPVFIGFSLLAQRGSAPAPDFHLNESTR
jgi:hypothetical protein